MIDLLQAKWNTFVKFRFYKQFIMFLVYFFVTVAAFMTRPAHGKGTYPGGGKNASSSLGNSSSTLNSSSLLDGGVNVTTLLALNMTALLGLGDNATSDLFGINGTTGNGTEIRYLFSWSNCIQEPKGWVEWVRLGCECAMLLGAVSFILGAWRECQFLGASMFFENLVRGKKGEFF